MSGGGRDSPAATNGGLSMPRLLACLLHGSPNPFQPPVPNEALTHDLAVSAAEATAPIPWPTLLPPPKGHDRVSPPPPPPLRNHEMLDRDPKPSSAHPNSQDMISVTFRAENPSFGSPLNGNVKDYRTVKRGNYLPDLREGISQRSIACRSDIERLNTHFLAIYESLIPGEEEKLEQKQLFVLLERLVRKEWPDARLYIFGSRASSFGLSKSDMDVSLAIRDTYINKSVILLKLAKLLQSNNLQNVKALTHTKVPIVKLTDPVTGISCDISINNVLGVLNTNLLRDYAKLDSRLRLLAFIVKHWANSRRVVRTNGRRGLSSYAYVLMCIHFLQQRKPPILPCLQEKEFTCLVTIDNIKYGYFNQVEKLHGFGSQNGESIAELVWAFFNYWAYSHDYGNDVISVRTGHILSKQAKGWTNRSGDDFHLICIEDPFETSRDLGGVVRQSKLEVLRTEFERAAEIMQHDSDPCVKLFQPKVTSLT